MVSESANGCAQYVPVTHISIHSGPDAGDDIVGVLLKGTVVQALDERNGWVRIGENKWVSLKFLTPNQWDTKSWKG
jgi:hypothetical protein